MDALQKHHDERTDARQEVLTAHQERDRAVASVAALLHAYIGITPGTMVDGLTPEVQAEAERLLEERLALEAERDDLRDECQAARRPRQRGVRDAWQQTTTAIPGPAPAAFAARAARRTPRSAATAGRGWWRRVGSGVRVRAGAPAAAARPVGYCRLCHAAYVASYRRGPGRETQAAYLAQRKARRHADPTYHPHRPSTPGRLPALRARGAPRRKRGACRDCAGALAAQGRRYCPKCGQDRPRADFYAVRPSHCRACRLAASRAHYQRGAMPGENLLALSEWCRAHALRPVPRLPPSASPTTG